MKSKGYKDYTVDKVLKYYGCHAFKEPRGTELFAEGLHFQLIVDMFSIIVLSITSSLSHNNLIKAVTTRVISSNQTIGGQYGKEINIYNENH
jgi:hypothetical protein